jgi:hypothetical protein
MEKFDVPQAYIENAEKKIEKNGLSLPITPDQLEAECAGDSHCEKALSEMLRYAVSYAMDVWNMKELVSQRSQYDESEWSEKLAKADDARTRLHNTYIDSIAILSRALIKAERDAEWVRHLMPAGTLDRATCGRFAIMLTYWIAVNK